MMKPQSRQGAVRTAPAAFGAAQVGSGCTHVIPASAPGGQHVLGPGHSVPLSLGDCLSVQAEQITWDESGPGKAG